MVSDKMLEALNEQINAELYSAYLYLSMAAYFDDLNLPGFANWMKVQDQEEKAHAVIFYNYVVERDKRVSMKAIAEPPGDWDSPLDVYKAVYEHEQHVTSLINALVDQAQEESDHATYNRLQWFIEEQVEEEGAADAIVKQLTIIGDDGPGLLMLDRELAQRVNVPPPPLAGG
jgi:ferritin